MDERAARERAFHDTRFGDDTRPRPAGRFYAINQASRRFYEQAIDALPETARVLEYGCGAGAYAAIRAAQRGHDVTAIDISTVALARASEVADQAGISDRIDFRAMNGERLDGLDDSSFDFVCGLGVLHHLDLHRALPEIARVISSEGEAVFVEPLAHNPALRLYRRLTPAQRTPDERPLRSADLEAFHHQFRSVTVTSFHLLDLLALPFRRHKRFDVIVDCLDAADRLLFRTPLRRWAWMAGIHVAGPLA